MNNKQLAEELIIRFSGAPARDLTVEAAKRLLQMAPEHEFKVPQEAGSLREVAANWPMPEDERLGPDWQNDYLRSLCTAAADRIEQMAETIEYARTIKAERDKPPVTFADQVRRMDDEALAWQFASLFAGGMGGVMEGMGMKFNVEDLLTMAYPRMMAELKSPAKEE